MNHCAKALKKADGEKEHEMPKSKGVEKKNPLKKMLDKFKK